MSDSEATPTIRRSGRERKQAKHFVQDPSATSRKRKRGTDDEGGDTTDRFTSDGGELDDEHGGNSEDGDDEIEDYSAPKRKATKSKKRSAKPDASKPMGPTSTTRKSRPAKTKIGAGAQKGKADASIDVVRQFADSHILDDNSLFNAIINPAAALQSVVEDYLDSLSQSPDVSLADLINFVLRACGCNDSVNADQAVDYDGVLDVLDTFTENLKRENAPPYPLVSKLPVLKKFRKQLSEFIQRLITSSAEMGNLYTSELMATLQSWVVAMSSSQLRSFRHTATVIAMELESALCEVAAEIEKEVVVVARQREGEKKRAGRTKSKGLDKELEGKATEIRERKNKIGEYLREFFDGVFVHRYRDHDPGIRAECVQAMGVWFKRHPAQFLSGSYLRYVGWVLSDADTHVRLEAVRSLQSLYTKSDYMSVLQPFTDRFKGRLVEMATSDLDLTVRVAVIQVLVAIDSHSLLDDEQCSHLCLLVYDEEPRVRKAVAGFVRGIWELMIKERTVGRRPNQQDKTKVGIKSLSTLLVQWGSRTRLSVDSGEDNELVENLVEESKSKHIARLVSERHAGRIALAVEALWDEVDAVNDWEALLDLLLLDHSASVDDELNGINPSPVAARRRQNAAAKKKAAEDEVVDELWRLTEAEEAVLLEVFVAALRKMKDEVSGAKKGEEDILQSDITRALIKGLPRLFAKHQTDSNRVADVLVIPQLMNVDMYLEMRMIPAYEGLWGDVMKQFLSHSSPVVLGHSMTTIQHFMGATLLSNTNNSKIIELEEELSTSLRDAIAGRDELEIASFSEDEVHSLGAIASRLVVLTTVRDMTSWMEEDEGGKQSSAWNIINALAERGRLGYREEEIMIDECLRLLTIHLAWKGRGLSLDSEPNEDQARYRETLKEQRETLLEKVTEYALGTHSNACDGVKRAAFHSLIDLHILFSDSQDPLLGDRLPPSALPITMNDETQYRCAGFVQAEVEQYIDDLDNEAGGEKGKENTTEDDSSHPESAEEEGEASVKKVRAKKSKARRRIRENSPDPHALPGPRLEREYILNSLLATFIRAIRVGIINPSHGAIVLAHYGRLGSTFDTSIKVVIDLLRDLGMFKEQGQVVSNIITKALEEAFTLFMDGVVHLDDHTVALAKALSSCFIIRGAQLSVIKRLESEHIVAVHVSLISWIVNIIAKGENSKDTKMCNKVILFFRSLQHLLVALDSRDALKIKAHLHQTIAQSKMEVNPTKAWEPYRAYEKRLSTVMSKDKSLPAPERGSKGRKSRKTAMPTEPVHTDDEVAEVEGLVSESGTDREEQPPRAATRPRPRPNHHREVSVSEGDGEDVFGPVSSPQAANAPSGRRSRSVARSAHEDADVRPPLQKEGQVVSNGRKSLKQASPRKRVHETSEDSDAQENDDPSLANRAPSPSPSHISISDIKNRRKRVRR